MDNDLRDFFRFQLPNLGSTLGAVGAGLTGCGGGHAATLEELPQVRFKKASLGFAVRSGA
ncbi:hypothetical protein [Hydrogenophaga sp.]|uniref:hypothetical protein n=1 Tax=Hydrogenophaga sp. TaxID=1904254 RepID=UPI002AC89775|nr:hypothetical protein [Hydrogenophaga sp.]